MITEYGRKRWYWRLESTYLRDLSKPIKAGAKKLADGTKLTRYLVFLPVFIGFMLTLAYAKVVYGSMDVNRKFVTLWVSASSLSLTFYAFWEKLFPTKDKILKDYEIEANKKLLEELKALAGITDSENVEEKESGDTMSEPIEEAETVEATETTETAGMNKEKIILRGRKNEEAEIKEECV